MHVSLTADGSRLVVGAYQDDDAGSDAGAVYIYEYDSTTGAYKTDEADVQKITAHDADVGSLFGSGVALTADGSKFVVGDHLNSNAASMAGAVRIYIPVGIADLLKESKSKLN
jgi:hypothetical protein